MREIAENVLFVRLIESFSVRFGTPADIPIPIAFTLAKPGVVTLVIDDAQGNRVRNLISETPFEAGKHVVEWDGCDDHESKQVAEQPVFTFSGNPVGPGRYTVRGIVRDPVNLRYEMPLYTAGNPPWDTPDGRGGWLQDYDSPTAVVGLSDKLLVIQDKSMPGFGLRHGNPIVPDNRSGTKVAEVPIEAPRGLAVTPDGGHLLAISGTKVVRFPFPPQGQPAVVVSQGLEKPAHLAVDTTGNIYVSDQGTHQVKVFSADGKPLRTIGKPGGPQLGPYDEQRMANPAGLAISADGRLWVAENSEFPRRVSIWTLDGHRRLLQQRRCGPSRLRYPLLVRREGIQAARREDERPARRCQAGREKSSAQGHSTRVDQIRRHRQSEACAETGRRHADVPGNTVRNGRQVWRLKTVK